MKTPKNKKTLEERIIEASKKHNFKYDYSLIKNYKNAKEKVQIICPIHGEFEMSFDAHINKGRGCPLCSNRPTYDKKLFIKKSNEVHNNEYDYSKVIDFGYGKMDRNTKVDVVCHKHGKFSTTIYNHLQGYGCPKCGYETTAKKRTRPFAEFEKLAKKIHGEKYIYIEDTYVSMDKDMKIICPKHGEFLQKPKKHIQGHGCQKCRNSRLEEEVMLYLEKRKIKYKIQYSPEFLKEGKGRQKLDFFLEDYNVGIECQGLQHFIKTRYNLFDDINLSKERDKRKYKKCLENGIKLIYYTTEEGMKYKGESPIYNNENIFSSVEKCVEKAIS